MRFERLVNEGRIQPHSTNPQEVRGMVRAARRDLRDAAVRSVSADRRFAVAYQVALGAARIVMFAEGYRPTGEGQHAAAFDFLAQMADAKLSAPAGYFDRCRVRRHRIDYDQVNVVSETEADQLLSEATGFLDAVLAWLRRSHPALGAGS